ncbi:MAG: hypothetical protein U5R31_14750 [Acidimicrobiia bacterium]|nr:hypothetical protein [Acidimicrobiia bacterium]
MPEGPPVEGVVPVWIAGVPGATSVAFVEETGGTLVSTREGQLHHLAEPIGGPGEVVLDLADRVATDGQEQGMFAVAIAKDGRHLYLSFTAAGDGALTILEYAVADGLPDPDTERLVMEIPQPGVTHNGGQLVTDDSGDAVDQRGRRRGRAVRRSRGVG